MNYIKGAAIKVLPEIIEHYYNIEGLNKWLFSLSKESSSIFKNKISIKKWYPIVEGLLEPTMKFCVHFYNWNFKGAWELGRYSADFGLKTIHKFFLRMGSPHFLIKKASVILPSYYKESKIDIIELEENRAVFMVYDFPYLNRIIDYRIAGWMERALEISGCSDVYVQVLESFENNKKHTIIETNWK